ncbi:ABC transporter ATP-binding protein [Sandarakinorhabdus oryzae]|uniref:ABC transporter ATP-binding protein n=1 Tax=Sandarakinorhabdus oryzae TaxID=2675220 RepID=UPI0012E1B711|nr:ATP-binding cassette domain-containing protein [Sandarakinorhabdus oryzae]
MTSAPTPRIELAGVTKRFGSRQVLAGIDLAVAPGESLVIIGGSGTGKSVMLKCILGLIPIDAGSIRVDGQEVAGLKGAALDAHRTRIGMLFQGGALFDSLPVWRNISFALPGSAAERKAAAIDNLARVGLGPEVADLKPAELSGGMQKRVALARAIAARPPIIFFDEPTAGLDPITAAVINNLIRTLVTDLKITALTITHDMASVRHIADRVAMLHGGKIIWQGPLASLDGCDNAHVRQFITGSAEGPIQMPGARA